MLRKKFLFSNFIKSNNIIFKRHFCSTNKIPPQNPQKQVSLYKRLKLKIKEYGLFGLYIYIFSYIGTGIGFYILVKCGVIDPEGMIKKIQYIGVSEKKIQDTIDYFGKNNTNIAVAVLLNEIFEVVRLPAVIWFLPMLARKFRRVRPKQGLKK